jgi:hypothetical protein
MSGEGLAAVLASLATLATALGNIVLQLRGQTESRDDRAKLSDKIDNTSAKVDTNTALTQATAVKVEEVHLATTAIVESTGTHQILK